MTEMLRQSLSAVIDDEADAFELRRVIDELNRDPELRAVWDRYNLIGSALRGERQRIRPDMRDRIWQALDGDAGEAAVSDSPLVATGQADAPIQPQQSGGALAGRRKGPIVGLAVAATVAFAVVFGSGLFSGSPDTAAPAIAGVDLSGTSTVVATSAVGTTNTSRTRGAEVTASDLQRAHAYMLHHTQQQAMNQSSVMSLVKLATYEAP